MYIVTNTSKIRKNESYKLINRFDKVGKIEEMKGFLGLEVMVTEHLKNHDEVKVLTKWEDEAAFKNWFKSDAFKASHQHGRPEYVLENEISFYQVKVTRNPITTLSK